MSTSEAGLTITADERYRQSLTYGLIISMAILSIIVCSLRVRPDSQLIKHEHVDIDTAHDLIYSAALHKSIHS